jgi:hypothetical protein
MGQPSAEFHIKSCKEDMEKWLGKHLEDRNFRNMAHENMHVVEVQGGASKNIIGSTLIKAAENHGCQLLVMASTSHGGLSELIHGSVANHVTHNSSLPVALLHVTPQKGKVAEASSKPALISNQILVAVDHSPSSEVTCQWTVDNLYKKGMRSESSGQCKA